MANVQEVKKPNRRSATDYVHSCIKMKERLEDGCDQHHRPGFEQ